MAAYRAMIAARGTPRYTALFAVILLIYWTTRFSQMSYYFTEQITPHVSQGSSTGKMAQRPIMNDFESIRYAEEASLSNGETLKKTPTSQTGRTSTEAWQHTWTATYTSRSRFNHNTFVLSEISISPLPSTTTTVPATSTAEYDFPDMQKEVATSEHKNEVGLVDQPEQSHDTLDNFKQSLLSDQDITSPQVEEYVQSILDLNVTTIDRLECPGELVARPRYQVLRQNVTAERGIKYLFAMDLYQSIEIMPRLLGTVVQAAKFLGPENCGLSIVEGRSTDGTYNVLHELQSQLSDLGLRYWLQKSDLDPQHGSLNRIEALAILRNMAFSPVVNETSLFDEEPLLIFLNDIAPCPDDIYETIYQHELQDAVQTCAMDWIEHGQWFYDVWVSRTMTGDTFFEIPQDESWNFVSNLFFDDPFTKDKFNRKMPFQVFSCWGGMTVIDGLPFINESLRIRRNVEEECFGGEPQLLGSDLAKLGLSRVQTLPTVNVGYSNNEGSDVKKLRKYVHELVDVDQLIESFDDDKSTERIRWKPPPSRYRCMPNFHDRWWVDTWYNPEKKD